MASEFGMMFMLLYIFEMLFLLFFVWNDVFVVFCLRVFPFLVWNDAFQWFAVWNGVLLVFYSEWWFWILLVCCLECSCCCFLSCLHDVSVVAGERACSFMGSDAFCWQFSSLCQKKAGGRAFFMVLQYWFLGFMVAWWRFVVVSMLWLCGCIVLPIMPFLTS